MEYEHIRHTEFLNDVSICMHEYRERHTTGITNIFDQHCLGYILEGSVRILLPGKELTAVAGDLLYISRESRYYSVWSGNPGIRFLSIRFDFANRSSHAGLGLQIVKDYPSEPFIRMYEKKDGYPMLAIAEMYRILDDLYRRLKQTVVSTGKILPALRYIEDHKKEIIPIDTLAALCCMSVSHFHAVFQKETGTTPIRYRHTLLVRQAMELLLCTNDTVEEISEQLGFSSSCYFRRICINITGVTPTEIRK